MMLCCTPLLYKWLISYLAKDMTVAENMNGHKWAQYLISLTDKNITWYQQILHDDDMMTSRESFFNVPFIGSNGCITYNPALAMR